jgi:anti-anti-sigma regulatory factor
MRRHAAIESAAEFAPFAHIGLAYRGRTEFVRRAAEYIATGIRNNQFVVYAAAGNRTTLEAELAAIPGMSGCLESDGVKIMSADDYYAYRPGTDIIDAERAVAQYLKGTQRAIDHGYNGFRAVSDVTPVARTPAQRDALAQVEYLVDQQMALLPFSALCGYDTCRLGSAADELVCLHPFVSKGSVAFRLYAEPDAEVDFALAGEIDAANRDVFATTLQRIWPLVEGHTVRIDAQELGFISHQQLNMLEKRASKHNRKVVLSTNQPILSRIVDLLDLTNVRVEAPGHPGALANSS